ncbi:MAG: patatin-like phospholipase family protein [Chlamydiia bacterium]|nr:patatin-like phospholipase family protein [Chlamydiia bacterium]
MTNTRILSFDGGGVRGAISLAFLCALEKETGISLSKRADVLAGTSTGSIIAGALSIGLSPEDILNFYSSLSSEIFKKKEGFDELLKLKSQYSSSTLYQALSEVIDPSIRLNQLSQTVVVPTINLDASNQRWRMQILTNSLDLPLIDAIMESTAAPTYFPSYHDHVDGGMAANDPSAVAYAVSGGASALLSIGTGYTPYEISKGEDWGALSWIVDLNPRSTANHTPLLTLLFDVQDQLSGQLCQLLLKENYYRLNLELAEAVSLDDTSKISQLIQETETYIKNNPKLWDAACDWAKKSFS